MMAWIYWGLCAFFVAVVASELWTERDFLKQATAALILIPLVLRILLWK
ncbi:MAG: hypothetical protein NUW23_11850 [Firmicutes bacterium]|jgi:hypothetical protein|nr:hypothetical protein [Bacillota bacterium]